jgi:hypothetical protein
MPDTLSCCTYPLLCAALLVWANARGGTEELWRVTLVLLAITTGRAVLVWTYQAWILPELTPADNIGGSVADPWGLVLAIMGVSLAVAVCDLIHLRRSLQVLVAGGVGSLVLLSGLGVSVRISP